MQSRKRNAKARGGGEADEGEEKKKKKPPLKTLPWDLNLPPVRVGSSQGHPPTPWHRGLGRWGLLLPLRCGWEWDRTAAGVNVTLEMYGGGSHV